MLRMKVGRFQGKDDGFARPGQSTNALNAFDGFDHRFTLS
jgi:hypothetical protein